jgi:hypothetical protein
MTIEQKRDVEIRTSATKAVLLDHHMRFMIAEAYERRHANVPIDVLNHAREIHAVALMFRSERDALPVTLSSGTSSAGGVGGGSCSGDKPEWISIATASELSGLSESYVRRVCREREVATTRKAGTNAWLISRAGWSAWIANREERNTRTEA